MFGFGLFLLASWAGWGAAIRRLAVRGVVVDRGVQAGWGLAFTLVVGGVLNLAGVVGPRSLLLLSTTGLALLVWDGCRRGRRLLVLLRKRLPRGRGDWAFAAAMLAFVLILTGVYAASVCSTHFNAHDDLQGYFVFAAKMIQNGAMGPDPYSERRIVSLGGMTFLHATVLGVADPRYVGVVDPGVGLLLSAMLLAGAARCARTDRWAALLVLCLVVAIPSPRANTTSVLTGLALFLTLFLTLYRMLFRPSPGLRATILAAVPIALTAAALCCLKTNHLPATVLLVAAWYGIRLARLGRRAVTQQAAVASALTLLFLAPWMLALYWSNGTLFYPLLGRGFHGSAHDASFWAPGAGMTLGGAAGLVQSALRDLRLIPLLLLGAGTVVRRNLGARRWLLAAWALSAIASSLALSLSLGGGTMRHRYSYPFVYAAIFFLMLFAFPRGGGTDTRRIPQPSWPVGMVAVGVLVAAHLSGLAGYWQGRFTAIREGVEDSRNPYFMRRYVRRYGLVQQAIPAGATVLTRLEYPFLLDFSRNQVFVADYPGGSSPPPGMPFFRGDEPLAQYLCGQDIRYVAYSYFQEAGFSAEYFKDRLGPATEPMLRSQAQHTIDFQRNLAELGRTRKREYDDGDVFVLDLAESASGQPLSCAPR